MTSWPLGFMWKMGAALINKHGEGWNTRSVGRARGTSLGEQDKLHNLRGLMQNNNTGPLFKFTTNFKKATAEYVTNRGPCVTAWVAHP